MNFQQNKELPSPATGLIGRGREKGNAYIDICL